MSTVGEENPRVLRSLPGRVRIHAPGWVPAQRYAIDSHLRELRGVERVDANAATGNVLVTYDPRVIDERRILEALRPAEISRLKEEPVQAPERSHVVGTGTETPGVKRVRIPIRGLDRDPELGRRLVEHMGRQRGVHTVHASALTSRLLVEYDQHQTEINDILSTLVSLDLPDLPETDQPRHPLDPRPLWRSIMRTVGAGLGLTVLGVRGALGIAEPLPGARTAVRVSTAISILQGIPAFRYGIRRALGREVADALIYAPTIVSLTLYGSIPGLLLTGAEALRLWTEVAPRRTAWKRYEERLSAAPSAEPGAVIRLEAGERPSRDARVIEGYGTALGRSGLPIKVAPGAVIPAGSRVFGGQLVVELQGSAPFAPYTRPAPPSKTLTERYASALGGASLVYAALTAITTRSLTRTAAALLLVTPRAALIGADTAELGASARAISSRHHRGRHARRPRHPPARFTSARRSAHAGRRLGDQRRAAAGGRRRQRRQCRDSGARGRHLLGGGWAVGWRFSLDAQARDVGSRGRCRLRRRERLGAPGGRALLAAPRGRGSGRGRAARVSGAAPGRTSAGALP